MAQRYDALVIGPYFCDMVFTGLSEVPQVGRDVFSRGFEIVPGGTFYTVLALHRLGVKVGWVVRLGNDLFSQFMRDQMAAEGIDMGLLQTHDFPVRRVAASFSFEHDRGFVSYVDPFDEPVPVEVIARHAPRCVVVPGLFFWPQIEAISQIKRQTNFDILLDCQHTALTLDTPGLADALRRADVFMPNEVEALHLTGEPTVERALARLAGIVPLAVIKRGANGAIARRGDEIAAAPALNTQVVDTTGAGDCFNAGFIFGLLRGDPLELCLRYGNITGGLSTTAPGAKAVPDLARALEIAQQYERHARPSS